MTVHVDSDGPITKERLPSLITGTVVPILVYRTRLAVIWSTVDQMWQQNLCYIYFMCFCKHG